MSNAPDTNRTEDVTSPEESPQLGSETGRQSLYFGANLPGMLGAAGILVTNPQSLGAFGIGSLAFGGGAAAAGYSGGPALLGQGFTGGLTPADISGSVYGFSSILPGYGSTAPGTYLTYRLMRNNPTVAIARLAATAPIRAADITVDGPDATDEQIEFISSIIQPLWAGFLRDALFALDYGWKGFEKVYAAEGGYTVLKRLKPLGVDITMIRWDEATGSFGGIEQQDVKLPPDKCFVWSYDQEDDAYYGRSRHENIRGVWWAWMELLRKEGQYLSKVAGVTPIMKYPEGSGRDASGALRPNFELAQQALCLLGRGNGIAMPNRVATWARQLVRTGIDVSQLASWQLEFLEPKGEHGQDFILQMQHKESLMLRGWLVPERAVAEGKYGTKAEAETHTDLAVAIAQHDLFDLLRCVNESIIDPLLALNFGPEARGLVTVTASPLVDDKAVLARNIVQAVLTAPNNADLALKVLDFDQMLEQQGLPTSGVGTEEALAEQKQNAPGPAPGPAPGSVNGTPGGRPPGGAGMGVPPSTDGQMADLAQRLARVRELSRWANGQSRGRGRSLTAAPASRHTPRTYAGPMDLAGFRPDQQRDYHGRWTKEGNAAQAIRDQLKDLLAKNRPGTPASDQEADVTAMPSALHGGGPTQIWRDADIAKMGPIQGNAAATQPSRRTNGRAAPASEDSIADAINEMRGGGLPPPPRLPVPTTEEGLADWVNKRHGGGLPPLTKAQIDEMNLRQAQEDAIAKLGATQRIRKLLENLLNSGKLSKALNDRLQEMLEPANQAMLAGVITAVLAGHALGVGEVIDGMAATLAAVLLGRDAIHVSVDMTKAIIGALKATTEEDFDDAATLMAHGLSVVVRDLEMAAAGDVAGKAVGTASKSVTDALTDEGKRLSVPAKEPRPTGGGGGTSGESGSQPSGGSKPTPPNEPSMSPRESVPPRPRPVPAKPSDEQSAALPASAGDPVLRAQAQQYAHMVISDRPWSWAEDFPGGKDLTAAQRSAIKTAAFEQGLIPNVPLKPGTKFADFEAAGLVRRTDTLPESLWHAGDKEQFAWLDARIPGGRPPGTTWHHSEISGRMELVDFGSHNITNHQGGRAPGMWADSPR